MGYTTDFDGVINIDPPLNEKEIKYINKFSDTRRMNRRNGPYYVGGTGMCGQDREEDVIDYNSPDPSQPGLWCQWVPADIETDEMGEPVSATGIEWDGNEKFYNAAEWMQYIIDHFIGENPLAKLNNPEHFDFLQGHTLNGEIFADGEEADDHWKIEVKDGNVTTKQGVVNYD